MLESIIKDKIMAHFDTNHFFMSNIATWFPSYDVMYYAVTIYNGKLDQELDDGNDVDIVYLDFCKAFFDCVPPQL